MRSVVVLYAATCFLTAAAQTVSSTAATAPAAPSTSSTVSSSQYWHERYHGLLSMAAYGDYNTECPKTFTQASLLQSFPDSTEDPWTVIEEWGPTASGVQGFNVIIPEMDKVVMVFRGLYGWEQLDNEPTSLAPFYIDICGDNCTAHGGALQAYLEAKEATNDWALVKQYVNQTGHQWSVTGHGFGGMVAQVAALDLGWRNLCHWSHSHGAPRVFSPAAASIYNSLFQGEAGQRTVANNDSVPTLIPESANYTFTLQGFSIFGTNVTYGMNYIVCGQTATDPNCLGGNNITDHDFYYTPIGYCGNSEVTYDAAYQEAYQSSESSSFYATATSTFNPSNFTTIIATPSSLSSVLNITNSSSSVVSSTSVPTSTITSTLAPTLGADQTTSAETVVTSSKSTSAATTLKVTAALLCGVGSITLFAL